MDGTDHDDYGSAKESGVQIFQLNDDGRRRDYNVFPFCFSFPSLRRAKQNIAHLQFCFVIVCDALYVCSLCPVGHVFQDIPEYGYWEIFYHP